MSHEHRGTNRDFSGAHRARLGNAQDKRGSGTPQLHSQAVLGVLPCTGQVLNPTSMQGPHTSWEKGECKDDPELLEQQELGLLPHPLEICSQPGEGVSHSVVITSPPS